MTTATQITNTERTIASICNRLEMIAATLRNPNLKDDDIDTVLSSIGHADQELSEVLNHMNAISEAINTLKKIANGEAA